MSFYNSVRPNGYDGGTAHGKNDDGWTSYDANGW